MGNPVLNHDGQLRSDGRIPLELKGRKFIVKAFKTRLSALAIFKFILYRIFEYYYYNTIYLKNVYIPVEGFGLEVEESNTVSSNSLSSSEELAPTSSLDIRGRHIQSDSEVFSSLH